MEGGINAVLHEPEGYETVTVPAFQGGFTEHHQAKPLSKEEYYLKYRERMKTPPISAWERKIANRLPPCSVVFPDRTVEEWEAMDARLNEMYREKTNAKLQAEVERIYEIEDHQLEVMKLDGPFRHIVNVMIPIRTARRERAFALMFRLTGERRAVIVHHGSVMVAPPVDDPATKRELYDLQVELGDLLDERDQAREAQRRKQYYDSTQEVAPASPDINTGGNGPEIDAGNPLEG